jgi:Ca2+-transporting ATPase
MTDWHNLSIKEVIQSLNTNLENGLSDKEIKTRRRKFGENKLPRKESFSKIKIFLSQFQSPLIYILFIAAGISLFLNEVRDAIIIFITVFVSSLVGYFQEVKASKILQELKKIIKRKAEVLRNGSLKIINAKELVPGDIIILNPGSRVPADGRIIESNSLKINEMALTGEWLPVKKRKEEIIKASSLGDRKNMVYMGTIIEQGEGVAIVTATGKETELGKIAQTVRDTKEEKTPYQKKIEEFSKVISSVIFLASLFIFIEGIINNVEFFKLFKTTIALAVASIPEALPIAITVILTLGTKNILKKKGLVRKLASAETLGSASTICVDKTGTLTEGKMKVSEVVTSSQIIENKKRKEAINLVVRIGSLFSKAFIEENSKGEKVLRGTPTDKALLEKGIEEGVVKEKYQQDHKMFEIPFSSEDKFTAISFQENDQNLLYLRGAPEEVLKKCTFIQKNNKKEKLNKEEKELINKKLTQLTKKGLRVIATAYKEKIPEIKTEKALRNEIKELTFTGFITLKDPVRKEVKNVISLCRESGINVIIITGDHKLTAKNVAQEIGIKAQQENILTSHELENISEEEFQKRLEKIKIYARVSPRHKSKIVQAWQDRGEVVAMTGDGINDAPALKKADIGLALASGTKVAQEASDIVLLNNNFSVIVDIIKEGRGILDNIRKSVTYLLSDGLTEFFLIGASIITKNPLPITAIQLLWVNLLEDSLLDMALAFEPKEKNLMKRDVRSTNKEDLLTSEMKYIVVIIAVVGLILNTSLALWLLNNDHNLKHVRTMIFTALAFDGLLYIFSCKSLRHNLWHINPFSNKLLVFASLIGLGLLFLSIYNPFLQNLLNLTILNLKDWGIIVGLGFIDLFLIEIIKWYFIVKNHYEQN